MGQSRERSAAVVVWLHSTYEERLLFRAWCADVAANGGVGFHLLYNFLLSWAALLQSGQLWPTATRKQCI